MLNKHFFYVRVFDVESCYCVGWWESELEVY